MFYTNRCYDLMKIFNNYLKSFVLTYMFLIIELLSELNLPQDPDCFMRKKIVCWHFALTKLWLSEIITLWLVFLLLFKVFLLFPIIDLNFLSRFSICQVAHQHPFYPCIILHVNAYLIDKMTTRILYILMGDFECLQTI